LSNVFHFNLTTITGSPAWLSRVNGVRLSSAKHETSTFRQSQISFDLKFGMSDNVMEVTSPAKFGSDPISGRDAMWGQHIRVL